jgi:3-methyladenine DNA glycosylase Tag
MTQRCQWCGEDPVYLKYHDEEWGFSFVGPTICYAFMQAVGMINDHTMDCFRYPQLTS